VNWKGTNSRIRTLSSLRRTGTRWQKYGGQKQRRSSETVSRSYDDIRSFNSFVEAEKKNNTNTGMTHMYRKMLEDSEQRHEEAVAATQKLTFGPQMPSPNLTIIKPPNFTPKSDLELAQIAREQGREVELNDDNQIVDKRELLAPGLNLSAPNTRRLGVRISAGTSSSSAGAAEVQSHRAVGTAASRREINERRAREILSQMEDEKKRLAEEQARADDEATKRIVARRNTENDVQSARERYLQRKRRKIEENVDMSHDP